MYLARRHQRTLNQPEPNTILGTCLAVLSELTWWASVIVQKLISELGVPFFSCMIFGCFTPGVDSQSPPLLYIYFSYFLLLISKLHPPPPSILQACISLLCQSCLMPSSVIMLCLLFDFYFSIFLFILWSNYFKVSEHVSGNVRDSCTALSSSSSLGRHLRRKWQS